MFVAVIATVTSVLYVTVALVIARKFYGELRPSKVPVNCTSDCRNNRRHVYRCFGEYTQSDALWISFFCGLFWPISLICLGIKSVITGNHKERPEEMAAKIKQLERELEGR